MNTISLARSNLILSVVQASAADISSAVGVALVKSQKIKTFIYKFSESILMSDLCPVAASGNAMNLDDQAKTIGESLLWLLKSRKFCDVIFTFPNRPDRIEAHQFCLKARSPVFEQIFRMMRKSAEIEISDFTPERFQQFLEFMYSDKFEVDNAGAVDLLQLSLKYNVQPLTQKCEQLLLTEIPTLYSITVFETARRHGCPELMDRAGPVMVKSVVELVRTDALVNAEDKTLVYLLQHDALTVQEVGLFQFILDKYQLKSIAGALDLLQLSQKYKVHHLTLKCEEFLQTEIPILDSVKVFEAAFRYGRRELMDRAGPIMAKSFLELARSDALLNAEEETLAYLLECDDLAVQEVGLFQFILDWGRHKCPASADEELFRNKLKNLILKIRYTNMAPEEFTNVVVPTGLLSAEETISIYTFFCGDAIKRGGFKTKFNTTPRKVENKETADFTFNQKDKFGWFPAFSKHFISFNADRTQFDGKALPHYFWRKAHITAITFWWPFVTSQYRPHHVSNYNVTIAEYSGPVDEENFTIIFQKELLNCKQSSQDRVSVEPPVEVVSGRTYSVIVEDHSTSNLTESFRIGSMVWSGRRVLNIIREANADFEDKGVSLTLKDIHLKTDFYKQKVCDGAQELSLIDSIAICLM